MSKKATVRRKRHDPEWITLVQLLANAHAAAGGAILEAALHGPSVDVLCEVPLEIMGLLRKLKVPR